MNQDLTEIVPRLYLSGISSARELMEDNSLGITHVLQVMRFTERLPKYQEVKKISYYQIEADDDDSYDLYKHFSSTNFWIRNSLTGDPQNRVLVHCEMGVSRSVTIICAYLLRYYGGQYEFKTEAVLSYVRSKHERAMPNSGFLKQLDEFAQLRRSEKLKRENRKRQSETNILQHEPNIVTNSNKHHCIIC